MNIVIYKDHKLHSLQEAYDLNLLNVNDLKNIAYYQNKDIVYPIRIPVNKNVILDEKKIWNGSINDHFADDSIVIIIDGNFTDWWFYAKDFEHANIELTVVDCLTVTNMETIDRDLFRQMYSITLKYPSKQNIIDAIKKLEKLPFIKYAGANYYYYPAGNNN